MRQDGWHDHHRRTARAHRRHGRRRPGDGRHGAQHRPPAPGHPWGAAAAHRGRRRAHRERRAHRRLHAPGCGEALRGARLPPDRRAGEPPRLALGLRQRARRGPGRGADARDGGAGAGGVGAHPARGAEPRPEPPDVPRLLPARARRDHPDLLRVPRTRGAPGGDGGGVRRPDALHVQPGRRPQGGPARRLAGPGHPGHRRGAPPPARSGVPHRGQRDPRGPDPRGRGADPGDHQVLRRLRPDRPRLRRRHGPAPRRALPRVCRAVRSRGPGPGRDPHRRRLPRPPGGPARAGARQPRPRRGLRRPAGHPPPRGPSTCGCPRC